MSLLLSQPVGPKAGTAGTGQDSAPSQPQQAASGGGTSSLIMFAPIAVLAVVLLMNTRNQKKKDAEVRSKLKKGDKVLSQSGLVGELVEMDERFAKVKIAPGTNVQMLVSTLVPLEPTATATADKQLKDLKEAKAGADKK